MLTLLAAVTLAGVAAAVVFGKKNHPSPSPQISARYFQVLGHIRGLDTSAKEIRIAHEEIPNYMPAMTMPFSVKDPALFKGLAVGDSVQFELAVTEDDSWISHIEKVQSDLPTAQAGPSDTASLEELEAARAHAGEMVPDFQLTDQDGQPLHLKDFHGQALLLTFIYTRCPLPNFCPLMSKNFGDLEQRLSKEFPGKFHLLSISMDSEFDRPEVLKAYAERYQANPRDWSFACGDTEAIKFVAGLMGLYFKNENGLISHDLRTALISPDGRLVQLWKSNVWTPYEVQRRVREVLTGSADVATR